MTRHPISRAAALLLAAALLASCSSTPVQVSGGPLKASSFSFVQARPKPATGMMNPDDATHAAIQRALKDQLAARGVAYRPSGGEVTVAYLVILGNNVATTSINDYFGYGRDAEELLNKARQASGGRTDYFEAGSLVLDVLDPATGRLLSREYVVRPLLRTAPAAQREALVREAVGAVLAKGGWRCS